jgi:hypothetical protein
MYGYLWTMNKILRVLIRQLFRLISILLHFFYMFFQILLAVLVPYTLRFYFLGNNIVPQYWHTHNADPVQQKLYSLYAALPSPG